MTFYMRSVRVVLPYLFAVLLPFGISYGWAGQEVARPIAAYLFFLCVALFARFLGFGPAVACTISSTLALWKVFAEAHPQHVHATRVLLFLTAALLVAAVSRQRAREARDAEKRLRALFDRAIDAIFFVDRSGRYVDANPSATKLLGVDRAEITKHRMGDFSPPSMRKNVPDLNERLAAGGTERGRWKALRSDGAVRDIEYRAVANILPNLHLVICHDVTDRANAERSLRELSGKLLRLQDEERSRISRQLHDTTAQSLAMARLHLVRISRTTAMDDPVVKQAVEESLALTDQSIAEIRTLSYVLHPPMIEEAGLLPSLRWYVRGFEERSDIATLLDAPETFERLPSDIETAVFRIVQEALTNVQRHSGSPVARVILERKDRVLRVRIEDEGHGLPRAMRNDPVALRSAGVGVAGIEQRARELGGAMIVTSGDDGTRIEVALPIPEG
jgi:two-component system NarL family sensor kinase